MGDYSGGFRKIDLGPIPAHAPPTAPAGKHPSRLQRIGQIDDVAARLARHLPCIAGKVLLAGEEREIDVVQVLRQHALDEGRLLTDRLELAERFVVVQQADILSREIAVGENVLQLAAFERSGTDNGDAKHAAPVSSIGARPGGFVWIIFHQACEASS